MTMVKKLAARKKIKPVFSKRLQAGYSAAPTTSFWDFKDYARTEVDRKETAKIIKEHIRKTLPKKDSKLLLQNPEWIFQMPYYIGATIMWQKMEFEFPVEWNAKTALTEYYNDLRKRAESISKEEKEPANSVNEPKQKSIQDIVKAKTSEFIADIEDTLDLFYKDVFLDIKEYSVFLELQKIDAAYNTAKGVYDYYLPLKEEIELLLSKKDSELVEAYSHLKLKKKKEYLELLTSIVEDAEKYMLSKKAVRAPRAKKSLTADKQVKSLKFLANSAEYKITSINPTTIVGAMRLYTFNIKNRVLTEYVCRLPKGFEIKGTTLQGIDDEQSRAIRLRKPDEFLPIVLKGTKTKIEKEWKTLTTKTIAHSPRINKDVLLLKVMAQ